MDKDIGLIGVPGIFPSIIGRRWSRSPEAVSITKEFDLATADRGNLVFTAEYTLNADGTHRILRAESDGRANADADIERVGAKARETIQKLLGRSLSIREVDAGSCNGRELEIVTLNNPIYDIELFGIHCPPRPQALLQGILLAVGRLREKRYDEHPNRQRVSRRNQRR